MPVPRPGILSNSSSVIRRKLPIAFIGVAAWRRDLTRTAHPCNPHHKGSEPRWVSDPRAGGYLDSLHVFSVARRGGGRFASLAATICVTRPGLTLNWLAMSDGLPPLRKRRTIVEFLSPFCLGMAGLAKMASCPVQPSVRGEPSSPCCRRWFGHCTRPGAGPDPSMRVAQAYPRT